MLGNQKNIELLGNDNFFYNHLTLILFNSNSYPVIFQVKQH